MTSIAAALGLHSAVREQKLANALQEISGGDMEYHFGVSNMAVAIQAALKAVQDTLGPPGIIDPSKVPDAAAVLGEYAMAFAQLESNCNYNALQLQESIDELQK